ncbi:MAG: hypothetical protein ACOYJS_05185, partial [Acutalibacteraceae bacterium]
VFLIVLICASGSKYGIVKDTIEVVSSENSDISITSSIVSSVLSNVSSSAQTSSNEGTLNNYEATVTNTQSDESEQPSDDAGFEYDPDEITLENDPTRPAYNVGNCRTLSGDVDVAVFFMDDDESVWDDYTIGKVVDSQIVPALEFLEWRALEWDIVLNLTLKIYRTDNNNRPLKYNGKVTQNLLETGATKDALMQAATQIGYESDWYMHKKMRERNNGNDVIYITLFNKKGIPYTICFNSPGRSTEVEHCVIYIDHLNTPGLYKIYSANSVIFLHEILHLFGAEDYYNNEKRKAIAEKKYPKDVMLCSTSVLRENQIGEYTAYSIGWTDNTPDVCYMDNWRAK